MTMDPNLNLTDAQTLITDRIDDYRNSQLAWFTFNSIPWNSDIISVINVIGSVMIGQLNGNALPDGFVWRDYNNVNHPVTFAYMCGLAVAAGTYYTNVYQASWIHKANVAALIDSISVQIYDYTDTLWPSQTTG